MATRDLGNGAHYEEAAFISNDEMPPPAAAASAAAQTYSQAAAEVDYSRVIFALNEWRKILNARLLALLALSGAMLGFAFCMYDPTPLRLWGLGIYAVLCMWPTMALFLRKG
jgi:uncharacterized membrane protein YjfL (UPF0719 family)